MEVGKRYTCCFVGPDEIKPADEVCLYAKVNDIVEKLIVEEKVDTFLFETKKGFEGICFTVVMALRLKYPFIQRIGLRLGFPDISTILFCDELNGYDDTYYPGRNLRDGVVYMGKKDERMELSGFCVIYNEETDEIQIKKA